MPERDWFDLELGIIVNGERLSLLPILLNLMRSHTEILNPEYPAPGALSFNYQGNYVSGQKNADIIVRQETQSL
ncbi:hypothetical protein ACNQS2_11305, partial [Corynebacterium diphtheriae]